eukprot:689318-Prorocentrum_minimum.AAC.2
MAATSASSLASTSASTSASPSAARLPCARPPRARPCRASAELRTHADATLDASLAAHCPLVGSPEDRPPQSDAVSRTPDQISTRCRQRQQLVQD